MSTNAHGEHQSTIGQKIESLRLSLQLSQEELAERCNCDVSVIRDLESDQVAPSLTPLIMVTRALGVRLGTILDDDENLGPVFTPASEYQKVEKHLVGLETHSDAGELTFHALAADKASRHMEPFYITLEPSQALEHTLDEHEGEEWIYALEGPLEIEYGKDIYVLQPGDSIYYDSIVPHQVRSHKGQAAKFVACVYTPA